MDERHEKGLRFWGIYVDAVSRFGLVGLFLSLAASLVFALSTYVGNQKGTMRIAMYVSLGFFAIFAILNLLGLYGRHYVKKHGK